MEQESVAALVLAAGESRRFGSPKQLALWRGRTLLEHVLELARRAGLGPVVTVVPVWLTRPASLGDEVLWIRNPHPERGMSQSLRLGMAAMPPSVAAALILLGDQPWLPEGHIEALLAARGPRPLVATRAGDQLGPPVLVERSHFSVVGTLSGDIGLREVLASDLSAVSVVPLPDLPGDIDTPDDLRRLSNQ